MWKLHGKQYDLSNFAKHHPGGEEIIEKTRGLEDCTALFESYHAFSDLSGILQSLDKYEIIETHDSINQTQDNLNTGIVQTQDNFTSYHELIARIKPLFPDRASIKAPFSWHLWTTFSGLSCIFCIRCLLLSNSLFLKCVLAIASGVAEMSILFNTMHDGSHYAISTNPKINCAISKFTNGWLLWNHNMWFYHHVHLHHSYTGGQRDPDKSLYDVKSFTNNSAKIEQIANFVYVILPGQYFMQAIWYAYNAYYRKISFFSENHLRLIREDESPPLPQEKEQRSGSASAAIPDIPYYDPLDIFVIGTKLAVLYSIGVIPTIFYIVTQNALYYVNVMADHDLYETHENHYDGPDWAKRQICNSGNFANDNAMWSMAFGGINYQIEHHLFPNVSNHHYPKIAPIVRQFCADKGLPYSNQPTVVDAYRSFMKKVKSA